LALYRDFFSMCLSRNNLDSRKTYSMVVIPAKTGTHPSAAAPAGRWVPVFAGMTEDIEK
jgi:hypothetical protein